MVCEADELACIALRPCIVCCLDVEVDEEAKSDVRLAGLEILGWGAEAGEDCWENERLTPGFVGSLKLEEVEAEVKEIKFLFEGSSCMRRRGLFRRRRASLIRSDALASGTWMSISNNSQKLWPSSAISAVSLHYIVKPLLSCTSYSFQIAQANSGSLGLLPLSFRDQYRQFLYRISNLACTLC